MKKMLRLCRLPLGALVVSLGLLGVGVASAQAAVIFNGAPGSGAPPATLGPYTMTPFPTDTRTQGSTVSSIPAPNAKQVLLSPSSELRAVGAGWATGAWAGGTYSGALYFANGATTQTLTLPPDTGAVYFYAEPDQFGSPTLTATAQNGTTSGPISVPVNATEPNGQYYGFYGTNGDVISSITVTTPVTDGFALGDFAIAYVTPTSLRVAPQFSLSGGGVGEGFVSATLTAGGNPVSGQTITFSVHTPYLGVVTLCKATTNTRGVATCAVNSAQEFFVLSVNAYSASYTSSGVYLGSSGTTAAVELGP